MERRLAAILAADVVGYSRLIREDEAGMVTKEQAVLLQERHSCAARHLDYSTLSAGPSAIRTIESEPG